MTIGRRMGINMKWCRDHRGMSLVEIILVLALIGILAGASATLMGHIRYANTKKAVEAIDTALNKQRVEAMSHSDTPYLYIYALSDGYYMRQLNDEIYTFDSAKLSSDGVKLCGSSTEIYMESLGGTKVTGGTFIRIAFKRSGVFDTTVVSGEKRTNVTDIVIKGSGTYTIHLAEETGKHYVN